MSIHGTAVALGDKGVLLRGEPGSGKSSLALCLIDAEGYGTAANPLRARLVADDQVHVVPLQGRLVMSPPQALAGLIEVRGWGMLKVPHVSGIPLCLVVDLKPSLRIERFPKPDDCVTEIDGLVVPRLCLDPAAPEAAARLRAVLTSLVASSTKEA